MPVSISGDGEFTGLTNVRTEALSHPAATVDNIAMTADGLTQLAVGFRYVGTRYFASDGTFAKADAFGDGSNVVPRAIRVRCQAAGGGGGGCAVVAGSAAAGNGGGGGAYAESFITDIAGLASSVSVTRGLGGAAGVGSTATGGSQGGSSSFGSTIVFATGGFGGQHGAPQSSASPNGAFGGTGGNSGIGQLVVLGGEGLCGLVLNPNRATFQSASLGGAGGDSVLGSGGRPGNAAAGGLSAGVQGGGGGARNIGNDNVTGSGNGASGGNGIVIVDIFV